MIIIKIKGGLGNQLFQYAFGRYLANKHQCPLKLDISQIEKDRLHPYGLAHFNIDQEFATAQQLKQARMAQKASKKSLLKPLLSLFNGGLHYAPEPDFTFHQDNLMIGDNHYIDGYWQSEHYFTEISDIIRNDLTLKEKPTDYFKLVLDKIRQSNSISLHIRRGDYITNPSANAIYCACPIAYYQHAVDNICQLVDSPIFYIFSDDIAWVAQHLTIPHAVHYIEHPEQDKFYEELVLMSHCQHNIIANSTFSWWGAWLNANNKKRVIAPKEWFRKGTLSDRDLVPPSWVRL